MSKQPPSRTAPPFPQGPLEEPRGPGVVAVRVGLSVRVSGTVDVLITEGEISRHGGLDDAVQARREDLAQALLEQGSMNEDDVEVDDLDRWEGASWVQVGVDE